jgi:Na+/phosphate symporter
MLILLLATCKQTEIALEAASNALDTDLTDDLGAMIERTERELATLTDKIQALRD